MCDILINNEMFEERINEKYSETNAKNIKRVYKKTLKFEKVLEKTIQNFSKEDLYKVIYSFNSKSYSTILVYINSMNIILEELGLDIRLDARKDKANIREEADNNYKECKTKKLFTEQEIQNIVDALVNPCDQFLVYGLFKGIELDDLIKLETSKVDLNKKKIYLFGKTIIMDEKMFDICSDLIRTSEYVRRSVKSNVAETYEFNMNSPYLIKVRRLSTNNDGMEPMKYDTAKMKLTGLSKTLSTEDEKIALTLVNLKRSGIYAEIDKMITDESDEKIRAMMCEYCYVNNIKYNNQEMWRMYTLLYR
ncbi:MAG: hypothetical protein ACRC18_06870 [Cetobacterium sp.]